MHIQIINFNLSGISRSEYEAAAAEAAQPISEMPGLISKRWLANEETNTYGGVYFWETKQHMQDWMDSQIFKDIGANPAFANAKVTDFGLVAAALAGAGSFIVAARTQYLNFANRHNNFRIVSVEKSV